MNRDDAERLARQWVEAFNAHDLERVMAHYAEDVTLTSPTVIEVLGEASGTVRGKSALRAYFEKGLARRPDLHFELLQVLVGVRGLTLYYRNDRGVTVAEVMELDGVGHISRVTVHHGS